MSDSGFVYYQIRNLTNQHVRGLDSNGEPMGEGFELIRDMVVVGEVKNEDRILARLDGSGARVGSGTQKRIVGMPDPEEDVYYIILEDWLLPIMVSRRAIHDLLFAEVKYAIREGFSGGIKGYSQLTKVSEW